MLGILFSVVMLSQRLSIAYYSIAKKLAKASKFYILLHYLQYYNPTVSMHWSMISGYPELHGMVAFASIEMVS